MEAKLIN